MKGTFSLIFLFCAGILTAQSGDTLRLYFEIDQRTSPAHEPSIDSLVKAMGTRSFNVWIYGYADFLHHDAYNQWLSQQRAEGIKSLLLKSSGEPQMTILACGGRGEKNSRDNGTSQGEAKQRRVDLIIEVRPPNKVVDTRPNKLVNPDTNDKPVEIDVDQLKKSGKITLKGLNFIPGRHTLMPKSVPVLRGLLTAMLQNPDLKIMIEGHICCWQGEGDAYDYDSDDNRLSHNRAKAVYDYLIERGVEPERMEYKGFSHSRPLVPEVSAETEQMNRRVEIRVVE